MSEMFTFLAATALFQNVVLTTGFGSSMALRVINRKSDVWKFGGILSFFLVGTMAIDYPLDRYLLDYSSAAKLLRPLVMALVAIALFCAVTVITARISVPFYKKLKPYLAAAVFNDLTLGLVMVDNHNITPGFWGTMGLAVGSSLGFMLIGWLVLEGRTRINSHGVPRAFRGAPVTLIYLGLAALAVLGFTGTPLL